MTKEEQEAFVKAKRFMAEILQRENMYQSYVDNIAVTLWASYIGKEFTTPRLGCNKAAKRILSVIFNIDERYKNLEWTDFLNFFILQWFFVRLKPRIFYRGYTFLYFIWPLTGWWGVGWWGNYRWLW